MHGKSHDRELTNEDRLVHETNFYRDLFDKMVIEGDFTHGYTWRLGTKGKAVQVNLRNQSEQMLTPIEVGILAIALSLREGRDSQERFALSYFLQSLGIVSIEDIIEFSSEMIKRTKSEHAVKAEYLKNCTENAPKIILLRRAYEALQGERTNGGLRDSESRIVLGYVIALLGGSHEFRPYMVDPNLVKDSWVDVYDHLFNDFSPQEEARYRRDGYESFFGLFHSIRNEIDQKKRSKKLASIKFQQLCARIGIRIAKLQ